MIVQTDWAALANRVAGQLAKNNIEGRGAVLLQDNGLAAFGADGDSVVPALRDYLADEPICKELGFATSGMTWAMLLEATEERDDEGIAELCDALNEFIWEVWLAANGRMAEAGDDAPSTTAAASEAIRGLRFDG